MTALRIDDLGASSKRYEHHPSKLLPYRELTAVELSGLWGWLAGAQSRCTLAITACWVTRRGSLLPYEVCFPQQAEVIRTMVKCARAEVACHGLTHCVVGKHVDWPWRNNREWHREFRAPYDVTEQVRRAKEACARLSAWCGMEVKVIVPPGGVLDRVAAFRLHAEGYRITGWGQQNHGATVLHDRDLVGRTRAALAGLTPPYCAVGD